MLDNNLPPGYIEEDELTDEEQQKILDESVEYDDSDSIREQ